VSSLNLSPNPELIEQVTACQRGLFAYIYALVGSRDLADEILQSTNAAIIRRLGEYEGRASFITWACRFAQFEVLAARKKQARERLQFVDDAVFDAMQCAAERVAAQSDRRLPLLRECMDRLPPNSRALIEERYSPDGSISALASRRQRSEQGLRVTLHRIRKQLLECIEAQLADAP
jgi:RNA polymerase sigma-70 factor (ECF subfamily)